MSKAKRLWAGARRTFRWCRITVLSLILLAVAGLLYLNYFGLPGFVKKRVVAALQKEGLDVEFSRLRLKGYRQIFIDDVHLSITNAATPTVFDARQAQLRFDRAALKKFEFKLESVSLNDGRLGLDLKETNGPTRSLFLENVMAELRLDAGDRWTLRSMEGDALGARWNISGSITNLMAARPKPGVGEKKADWRPVLREISATLERIQFASPPQIEINISGDLKDLALFKAFILLRGEAAATPWGQAQDLFLRASLGPSPLAGQQTEGQLNLRVSRSTTEWGEFRDIHLMGHTVYPLTNSAAFESAWTLRAEEANTRWASGRIIDLAIDTRVAGTNLLTLIQASAEKGKVFEHAADRATLQARLEHGFPVTALNIYLANLLSIKPAFSLPEKTDERIFSLGQRWNGDWRLNLEGFQTTSGAAGKLAFSGDVRERQDRAQSDASWGFWEKLAPFLINWRAEAIDFRAPEAKLERVSASGNWNAPKLTVDSMDSQLYGGSFHLDAALDVLSREVRAKTKLNFDLKQIAWLLDPEVRPFLDQFTWEKPPEIEANLALTGPPWEKPPEDIRNEVFKSMALDGSLTVGAAAFRGVTCSSLTTHFSLTNFQWRLPDLVLTRPEGSLHLDFLGHVFKPEFRLGIRGGIDPWAALPLLSKQGQIGLKFVKFQQPPSIIGTLTGDMQKPERLSFVGDIAATNLIVRGEPFLDAKTHVTYSNLWIGVQDAIAHRTTNEVMMGSAAGLDLKRGLMYLTNGFSTTDPTPFSKIIGPSTFRALEPYKFVKNPTVRGEGIIPLRNERDADLRFHVIAEDFAYWRFNMTKTEADIHWHHEFLDVTNLTANFYGGGLDWEGHFLFKDDGSADYKFKGVCTNVDFSALLHDLLPLSTNKLDGTVNGTLVITEANSKEITSWKGHGEAELKNGFLWDIPIFGVLSPALDVVVPGFGKSRVSSGQGTFTTEGGKVFTKDMEVRAPAFRLKYDGSVDFDGNLDAKVEAQLLRDAWIFGRAFSAAFWPLAKAFESKISGHLSAPKSELAHIPKVMLFPLRPLQTLKDLLPKDKEKEKKADEPAPMP